jgi:replicative DNA helicase
MKDYRERNGRRRDRTGRGGRRDDLPMGYFDAREAAMEAAEYDEIMRRVPNNIEAEAALLGALMIDNRWVMRISTKLQADHFLEPTHARIYDRIVAMVAKEKRATPVTLKPFFEGEVYAFTDEKTGKLEEMGLPQYLASLTGSGAALIGAHSFADQIFDLHLHRELLALAREVGDQAANTAEEVNPRAIIQFAEERLIEIEQSIPSVSRTGADWEEAFDDTVREAEKAANGEEVTGIVIHGYDDWNDVVGRMEPADYIGLGGRPSMGKTAIACSVAAGSAMAGHGTDFLSLEMPKNLISRRVLANLIYEQGVTSTYAEQVAGRFTKVDHAAIAAAREKIKGKPLYIDSPDEMFVEDFLPWLRVRARAWKAKGVQHKLVIVDYLDRFQTRQRFSGETERVGFISRTIKTALRSAGVAGVILMQLSRAVEAREDKHPMLSDLRQSGSLEQDCDVVTFVYRDEYYLQKTEPKQSLVAKYEAWRDDMAAARDRLELYSAKRREGALTRRTGYFFANEQAVRSSTYYRTDLYRGGQQDSMDLGDDPASTFGGA